MGSSGSKADFHRSSCIDNDELSKLFFLCDKNNNGSLAGAEVKTLFASILGREVDMEVSSEINFNEMKRICNNLNAHHPAWGVARRIKQFIADHQAELEAAGHGEGTLNDGNLRKLFELLDKDQSRTVTGDEAARLFMYLQINEAILLSKAPQGGHGFDVDSFSRAMREINKEYPQKNLDQKILGFIHSHAGVPEHAHTQFHHVTQQQQEHIEAHRAGTRKALCVGINYLGTPNKLGGCINDAHHYTKLLREHYGFRDENILVQTEDQHDKSKHPTAKNMRSGIQWLMQGAQSGDVLFFSYSGHGSQVADKTGMEADGKSECLVPLDALPCHHKPWPEYVILDQELDKAFRDGLPDGVVLVAVVDCCHSGTMTDLACKRGLDEQVKEPDQHRAIAPPDYVQEELNNFEPGYGRGFVAHTERRVEGHKLLWTYSGCQDSQTSADATIDGERQGAMSWALLESLEESQYSITYEELLAAIKKKLRGKFAQIPSLSTTSEDKFQLNFLAKA